MIWTTTTYMVVYCCAVWLAFWMMNTKGLRTIAILASATNMLQCGITDLWFVDVVVAPVGVEGVVDNGVAVPAVAAVLLLRQGAALLPKSCTRYSVSRP